MKFCIKQLVLGLAAFFFAEIDSGFMQMFVLLYFENILMF